MSRIKLFPFEFGKAADHRTIFAIALPMIISNIAAPLLGLVDTAIIGHLPQSIYLSAVALGAMIVSFVYLLAIFLRMTTTAEIASAFGAGNHNAQQRVVLHGLLLAIGIGILIWLVSPLLIKFAWWLIAPEAKLESYASSYISIRLVAAPAALINLLVLGVLLGRQQSKQAMTLVIFTNAVNVIADVVLIIGLGLNVEGAAWASVLAEISTALLGLWLIKDTIPNHRFWHFEAVYFKRFVQMNRDVFVRSLLLQLCMATMTGYAARFGTIVVAANAVLMQFLLLISLGLDGIAYAVEALLGAARGRKNIDQVKYWMRLTLFWSVLFAFVYCLIFWVAGNFIIRLLTDLPNVIDTATQYLPWLVILPLLGHWSYYFDGVFIGLGLTAGMRNTMAISAIGIFFPAVIASQWLLPKESANHGLWLALSLFLLARGVSQWLYLKQLSITSLVPSHPAK